MLSTPKRVLALFPSLLTIGALTGASQSCVLNKKQTSNRRGSNDLIVRDSIYLDRIAEGAAGRLQFKTNRAAICEISYYSQESNVQPTKDKPLVIPCSGQNKARLEFTERLENLSSATVYFVVIAAWEPTLSKAQADVVTVREGVRSGSTSDPTTPDGNLKEIYVGRIDIPLKAAEFHKHTFSKPISLTELKQSLNRNEGCQVSVPKRGVPYREASGALGLTNLASRDLATGTATPHQDDPQRLTMQFAGINSGMDKWSLFYQSDGRDVFVPVRPIAAFSSVQMTSAQSYNFDAPQLSEASDPVRVDPTLPLRFAWTSSSPLTSSSYVTVQIGRANNPKAIYCIFSADKKSGAIDPQLLSGLPPDKYVISIEIITHLVMARENWLVTSHDWRSGRIAK